MQAQDIERSLAALGQELQHLGVQKPLRLLLVGGAFMLTQIGNRRSTNDVDVLLKDVEHSTNSPLSQTLKAAVRAVARKQTLPNTWLNDLIGDFLRDTGTAPEETLWRTYGVLEVFVPPSDSILALTLFAGRLKDRGTFSPSASCWRFGHEPRHSSSLIAPFPTSRSNSSIIWMTRWMSYSRSEDVLPCSSRRHM